MPWRFWRRTTAIRFQALSTTFLSCKRMIMWARPDTNCCVSSLGVIGRSLLMRQKKSEFFFCANNSTPLFLQYGVCIFRAVFVDLYGITRCKNVQDSSAHTWPCICSVGTEYQSWFLTLSPPLVTFSVPYCNVIGRRYFCNPCFQISKFFQTEALFFYIYCLYIHTT